MVHPGNNVFVIGFHFKESFVRRVVSSCRTLGGDKWGYLPYINIPPLHPPPFTHTHAHHTL